MKPLYFTAGAHPKVAPALATQVHESLRPHAGYLKSALAAAVKRESRSACRWEPAPREHRLRLEPMDSLLIMEADGFGYRLDGWPGDAPDMPLFVGDEYRPMKPRRIERAASGLLLVLDEAIDPSDRIFWEGKLCTLAPAKPSWPAKLTVRRHDGSGAHLLQRREEAAHAVLVVEGRDPVVIEDEHGAKLPHRVTEPHEGATCLRADGTEIPWKGQGMLTLEALPDRSFLSADNGVRWRWSVADKRDRQWRGVWIQLLAPDEPDSEAVLDVRAAYCEEGVREVRTREDNRSNVPFRVLGFHRDHYRLELDRLPPDGSTLFIPSSTSGLKRQRQAVFRFKDRPLPHHRPLLKLCEAPDKVRWPRCRPETVSRWYLLDDARWSGTVQQRQFVQKALGTPDFAFLEGPPGSGKTHAICELVLQLVDRGKNVLLCSTTHVAVDNVLERLAGKFDQVEAVRIGVPERVDQAIRDVQIDELRASEHGDRVRHGRPIPGPGGRFRAAEPAEHLPAGAHRQSQPSQRRHHPRPVHARRLRSSAVLRP